MNQTEYVLRPRSGTWAPGPSKRLVAFDITVEHGGEPLGGHNVQAILNAPDYRPPDPRNAGLNDQVVLTLDSGWWITLRNQFGDAPGVAARILSSAAQELSRATSRASEARGNETDAVWSWLITTHFDASGPDYW
jgi:hypothetical protein